MRAEGQQVCAQIFHIERDASCGLHGVNMQQTAIAVDDIRHLRERLDNTCFIVRGHDGHQGTRPCRREFTQSLLQRNQINNPARVDPHPLDRGRRKPAARQD